MPPFSLIEPSHFEPAFEIAMAREMAELQAIVDNSDDPTFDNVIVPYDRSGHDMSRISGVYQNLGSSVNTDDMKAVQTRMSPLMSRHSSASYTLPGLFAKIDAVHQKRSSLTDEQQRLVERIHLDFQREGAAHFSKADQEEYAELSAQLATLCTQFAQNVLKDEETYELRLKKAELEGCPQSLLDAAKASDEEDAYVVTLGRSMVEPILTFCSNRETRQKVWEPWTKRGQLDPDRQNLPIAIEILKLRHRQARLHGCKTFAEYQTMDTMAKTPKAVMTLLENVWERSKLAAQRDREKLQEMASDPVEPWDWRYYAEKYRSQHYDLDEAELRPYFTLKNMRKALFHVSKQLYGLDYIPRPDLQAYHADVDVYEVQNRDGQLQAIFLHDNFARKFKSSGAWMSEFRTQTKNLAPSADAMESIPIVVNNNNFVKGSSLSFDDARTLFHEAGHGHHGMLSDSTYSRLASTNVLGDFVELPSQLMEHWMSQRQVLKEFARHESTNEPIPDELLDKLLDSQKFDQAFASMEYTACALMDMTLHQIDDFDALDIDKLEESELNRLGMPEGIAMRHRPAHFLHLFAGPWYASGYYYYLWAEVLDADAFGAFEETGDIFHPTVAKKARDFIYSAGNTVAPDELFRQFRGRDPDINFMLKKKGLI